MEKTILNYKIYDTFDGERNSKPLSELCLDLLSDQKENWQNLKDGYKTLKIVRERDISCNGFSVRLQFNPGRMKSSTANARGEDTKERRCFLCQDHLPDDQKGILYRNEYLILCNPMPVFTSHFTVSHIDHRRQSISENIESFLQMMVDLGVGWTLLYNGPKCGASAPDHLHFQVVPSRRMPIEKGIEGQKRLTIAAKPDGVSLHRLLDFGREAIMLEGVDPSAVGKLFKSLLEGLLSISDLIEDEPMVNLLGFYKRKKWHLVVFPRRKHRPDIYFKEGDARIVVSPGAIDMGGVLITPVVKDFERLDKAAVESIYGEVSLEGEIVGKAIDSILEQGNS